MHKIVFLDRATISPQITLRRPVFPHILTEYQQTAPDDVPERLAGAFFLLQKSRCAGDFVTLPVPQAPLSNTAGANVVFCPFLPLWPA